MCRYTFYNGFERLKLNTVLTSDLQRKDIRFTLQITCVEADTFVCPMATGPQQSLLVLYGAINVELLLYISRMHRRFIFPISEACYLLYLTKCVYLLAPNEYTNTPVCYAAHQLVCYNEASFFAAQCVQENPKILL